MQREIQDRIRKLESVISDIELERQARLEALSTIFPWNALSLLEAIGSGSFIPGLCPIAASDPAIWISFLYPWILPGWSAMSLGDR